MYYIIEHQIRPDGVVNTSEVGRAAFASALSHYYERKSKLVMNTDFTSAHLMLVKEDLTIERQAHIETLYTPQPEPQPGVEEPKDEPTPEPTPEPEPEPEAQAEEENEEEENEEEE